MMRMTSKEISKSFRKGGSSQYKVIRELMTKRPDIAARISRNHRGTRKI